MTQQGRIRVGVGGWVFEPWRGAFYPDGLRQADELAYMASQVTAIEINATYYGMQKPESWRKWASQTPDGFKFAVKGSRFCTNRRELASAGEAIGRFFQQGLTELGPKLGPVLWQFAPTKRFDPVDFRGFLELLPKTADGLELRHVVEARHDSFRTEEFIALLRQYDVPVVFADHASYPGIWDVTGDLVYARLQTGSDQLEAAYPPQELDRWSARLQAWANGGTPEDLPRIAEPAPQRPREVFAFVIHEGKLRAPAAARAIIQRLGPQHAT